MEDRGNPPDEPELLIKGLSAGYGRKAVLRDLSVSVMRGELLAVIGANGAGKSTLLKAIMGLATVTAGTIAFSGRDITRLPTHRRVQFGLSYLVQGAEVFPSLTVRENFEVAAATLPPATRFAAVDTVLSVSPQIKNQIDTRAGLLSGGQRQAVAIGMMLVRKPRVLLLDEPSAGLAPRVASETLKRVVEINQVDGVTVVVVEQRVRQVLEIATRAIILNNGSAYAETHHPSDWLDLERIEQFIFGSSPPERS